MDCKEKTLILLCLELPDLQWSHITRTGLVFPCYSSCSLLSCSFYELLQSSLGSGEYINRQQIGKCAASFYLCGSGLFPKLEARPCWVHVQEEMSAWGSPWGQVQRHGQPVTTLGVSVPLLKHRRTDLNLRGLSSPVPGWAVHDSETQCLQGRRGAQETTPNHFFCPCNHLQQMSSIQQLLSTYYVPALCKSWEFSSDGNQHSPCSNATHRIMGRQMIKELQLHAPNDTRKAVHRRDTQSRLEGPGFFTGGIEI